MVSCLGRIVFRGVYNFFEIHKCAASLCAIFEKGIFHADIDHVVVGGEPVR